MAEKTANEILDDMKNAQEALVDDNLKKYKAEKDKLAAQADANAAAESAGGSADYQNYIMPDNNEGGIQSDAISRLGLNRGKLSETNQVGGYNAYQSRLAAAADAARRSQEQLDLSYGMYDAQSKAEKFNAQANYNAMRNSEYWKKANWDYQLAADKKAEDDARRASAYRNYSIDTIDTTVDPNAKKVISGGGVDEDDYGDGFTGWWRKQMLKYASKTGSAISQLGEKDATIMAQKQAEIYLNKFRDKYKGNNSEEAIHAANYLYNLFKSQYGTVPASIINDFGTKLYNIQNGG